MAGPVNHNALHGIAQHKHGRHHDRQGHVRVNAPTLFQRINTIEGHHERGAMRKIDDVQHTIDQGQPERNQSIDCARGQTIEQGRQQNAGIKHHQTLLLRNSNRKHQAFKGKIGSTSR